MNVDSVASSNATANKNSESSSASATVDYNQFLQLLIAQMKNQDPTNPTDMSQYMSQFAQLSAVEQAIQTNAKLDTLLSSSALAQAESLVGRTAAFTTPEGEDVSGKIMSVRIIQGGAVATLDNGVEVLLGPGITIS
ncbi:flagellar hook assembly protein FlgD [Bradyrhizobium cenepequi]|uniref:flagellar hook assembly protein FlgD n=1 Tax=Bradyrhizobium cenepequi TaxID=2821403 RepID=UPI001CE23E0D|nr:flagellar hook assembly protein FlgD [Bradyrhizobium cenepequi]MCA6106260.1 flagellar hook assembly protein FlgD [Bradyrhizobium cenepequi]